MSRGRLRAAAVAITVLSTLEATLADDWTKPVEVLHETTHCLSYRARLAGPYLIVRVNLEPGWHTFAMDNQQRAEEKLAGKRSLGIERSTEVRVPAGLEVIGPWYQTPPKDSSKPELNWFTWIFDQEALFVARVRRSGTTPARIAVRGQACAESICKNIDVELALPLAGGGSAANASDIDLSTLVQVRQPR